jgi:hypothetical protein
VAAAIMAGGFFGGGLMGGLASLGRGLGGRGAQRSGAAADEGALLPWSGGGGGNGDGGMTGRRGAIPQSEMTQASGGGAGPARTRDGGGGRLGDIAAGLSSLAHTIGDLGAEASGEPHPITPSRLLRSMESTKRRNSNSSERARQYLP